MTETKLILLPEQQLKQLTTELASIDSKLEKLVNKDFSEFYIDSKKIPSLLNISGRTWQSYRDTKQIPFIQLGSKIWVKRTDIDKFMDRHLVSQ